MVGGKYKLLIIYYLDYFKSIRPGKLKKYIYNISQKTLTKQLKDLEEMKLVKRTVFPEVPPHVEYSLTQKGETLIPILMQFCDWGKENAEFDYELINKICDGKGKKKLATKPCEN
jgi:DNA-binding HxlR family transcriptional regulator